MRIIELQMKHFGKFSDQTVSFHEGINVICGNNEMGKTTMHAFIRGMFFGIEKQRGRASKNDEYSLREPWENANYYAGVLRFESGGKLFRLERNFQKRDKSASLVCETDGEELSLEDGDLESLLEGLNEASFRNTVFIPQRSSATDEGLAAELRNYMTNIQNTGDGDIDVNQALGHLDEKRRQLEGERKKALLKTTQACQELRMRLDYVQQEIGQISQEYRDAEIQLARAEEEWQKIQERKRQQEPAKKEKHTYEQRRQQFLILAMGLAALLVCVFVPVTAVKAVTLAAWLVLFGLCIWRKRRGGFPATEAEEESNLVPQESRIHREAIGQLRWKKERILEEQKEKETICANLLESLEEMREQEEEARGQELEIEAVRLAMGTIKSLSDEIYQESARKLNERISAILGEITGGKYTSIFLDANMEVRINTPQKLLSLAQVSRGTMDQIYFALRMAVGEMLCQGEPVPVLLDDAFAMYDDDRLERTLNWLKKSGRQVILFTCHKREQELLAPKGPVRQ